MDIFINKLLSELALLVYEEPLRISVPQNLNASEVVRAFNLRNTNCMNYYQALTCGSFSVVEIGKFSIYPN